MESSRFEQPRHCETKPVRVHVSSPEPSQTSVLESRPAGGDGGAALGRRQLQWEWCRPGQASAAGDSTHFRHSADLTGAARDRPPRAASGTLVGGAGLRQMPGEWAGGGRTSGSPGPGRGKLWELLDWGDGHTLGAAGLGWWAYIGTCWTGVTDIHWELNGRVGICRTEKRANCRNCRTG